ncbi:MAG: SH3 domain-containing protein [Caldilineaceae bacterium]
MLRSVFNQINIGGVWTEILASRKTVAARSRRRRGHLLPLLFIATLLLSGSLIVAEQPLFAESRALPVAQSSQGIFAVAGAQGADLYDQPDGTVLESLLPGTTLTAVGRTADSRWLSVETSEGSSGWVAEATVVIFGEDQLPVVSDFAESAPTADADQAEASATAADAPAADVTGTAVKKRRPQRQHRRRQPHPQPTAVPPTPTPVPPTPTPVPPTPTPVPTPTRDVALPPLSTELIAVVGSEGTTFYPNGMLPAAPRSLSARH